MDIGLENRETAGGHWAVGRKVLLGIGALTLIAGLALLAFGSFQLLSGSGTAVQPGIAPAILHGADPGGIYDRSIVPRETPTPAPTAAPPSPADTPPLPREAYRLVIDKIGVNAPVGVYGLDGHGVPQVPFNASEVAWYDFSSRPGTGGNAVFAGHVTWSGRGVFYDLAHVQPGDRITLRSVEGPELVYEVSNSFMVDPNDPASLSVMANTDRDMITIITCDGDFFYTGDPVFRGDYTHRRIVQGDLVAINDPADQPAVGG
jgi:LPXTG-site transpeptidase (sortase) family protein